MHYVPHLIGQSDSTHTTGILGTVPLAKHGVLLLPLLSAHISCSLCIDIGLFAISFLLIASSALIYNPCISLLSRPPSPATRHGIYTPSGVCSGFGQAFRGPVRPAYFKATMLPDFGATARLMRRGAAYVRFPLRLSHHVGQFSAGIVILSEVLRYAQIIRERLGLW